MNRRMKMIAVALSLLMGVSILSLSIWDVKAGGERQSLVERMSRWIGGETAAAPTVAAAVPFAPTVTATKTDSLFTDVNGNTQADPGDTLKYTVTIGASGMDATGVTFSDTLDANTTLVPGSVMTTPIARPDSYTATGNVRISIGAGAGVLANDSDPDAVGPALTVTAGTISSANSGNVVLSADGSFTYNPPPGFEGTDTFTYTLNDGEGNTDTATATITVSGMIWFINNNAAACTTLAAGCGRLTNAFSSLSAFNALNNGSGNNPAANDNIFLYESGTDYTGPVTLLSGQRLIGQDATATLSAITGISPPAGSDPLPATNSGNATIVTITSASTAINVASGNTLRGFTVGNSTTDINGSGFGTLTVADVTLNGTGQALNLTTGTLAATFGSISSTNSGATGINLSSVGGSLTSSSTTITNPTGIGIQVQSAPTGASFSFNNTNVSGSGGTGVRLIDNVGNVSFGDLDISPDANQRAFHATNAVTNSGSITTSSGTISASGVIAVEVNRTSAGTIALMMTLDSVSANGGSNGIKLNNTNGFFTVNGVGTTDATGGTIQSITTRGAEFINATNITLKNMNFTNAATTQSGTNCANLSLGGNSNLGCNAPIHLDTVTSATLTNLNISGSVQQGINGRSVTNFVLSDTVMTGIGDAADEDGIHFLNMLGTSSITNTSVSGSFDDNLIVQNLTGTTNLTISGSSFTNSTQGSGMLFGIRGGVAAGTGSNTTINITGGTSSTNNFSGGIVADTFDGSTMSLTVSGSTSSGNNDQLSVSAGDNSNVDLNANGNTLSSPNAGDFVVISLLGSAFDTGYVFDARIQNNTITVGNDRTADGIIANNAGGGALNAVISGNTIDYHGTQAAITIQGGQDGSGAMNFTVTGNNIDMKVDGTLDADVGILANVSVTGPGNTTSLCADIGGSTAALRNTFTHTLGGNFPAGDVRVRQRNDGTVRLPGYGGAATDTAAVVAYLTGRNTLVNSPTATATAFSTGFAGGGACAQPVPMSAGGGGTATAQAPTTDEVATRNNDTATKNKDIDDILEAIHQERSEEIPVASLTQMELNWGVLGAIERWSQAGLPFEELQRLRSMTFEIADLPGNQLAKAVGMRVEIDATAAGYGWYVDHIPSEDSEFDVAVPDKELQTTDSNLTHGRVDLLTVVARALGLMLNERQLQALSLRSALMEKSLGTGVRRLPAGSLIGKRKQASPAKDSVVKHAPAKSNVSYGAGKADISANPARPTGGMRPIYAAFPSPVAHAAPDLRLETMSSPAVLVDTVNLNIGTLPAGKSIVVTFNATINNPFPAGVCQVSNQGTVSGSNFSPAVQTNTVTRTVQTPPTITAAAALSRQQGSAASTSQIATVNDCNQTANTLTVSVTPLTGSGVTIGSPSVDAAGNVTASVSASCTATNSTFTLTVTDATSKTATATLTVNITANTPPTLGTYPATSVATGGSTTVTPSVAPTDNGTVSTLAASAPGFGGTLSGNPATGVITVTGATPGGVYTVTVTATDNCGATSTATFQLTVNNAPTITGATISRQQGSAASSSQIATVSDADQAANTLTVTVNGGASATVNGVTVSGISVDGSGNVTASVVASCTGANASFTLTVTDNQSASANATLTVNVTANPAPTLGNYPATSVVTGGSATVTPAAAPTDNGTITSLTASAPGFSGTFSGNTTTGVITITNASPGGVYTVTVTATDNCGATSTKTFQLTVNTAPTITGATISRQQGSAASSSQIATVNDSDQPLNTLTVTVNGGASATSNGVTVSGISVDASGNVTASVAADCTASNASFTLTVTDNQNASANATLTVNVTANTPPALGNYPNTGPVAIGANLTVTPSAAPTDNGTVSTLTASAPGFAGTFSGNPTTGVITITNASPGGVYTVTVTATDNCGATATRTFQLTVNNAPAITGATISRQQGSPASTSQIATVSDADQAANTLTVTVNGGASATVNGVTVSGISVDSSGNVTASVVASCTATNATFTLTVTDNLSATATATLTVNVTANTPPALGTYPGTTMIAGNNTTVTPSVAPSDNGSVSSLTASAPGFTGTFSGNPTTGVVTISNAGPAGSHTVTVTATDNCGATATTTFSLTVNPPNSPPTITGGTISRQQGAVSTSQIATVSDAEQAANTLTVTVNGGSSATVNGVTVSGLSVNASGQVTASVGAACNASSATFTLRVTDSGGLFDDDPLTVTVTPGNPAVEFSQATFQANEGAGATMVVTLTRSGLLACPSQVRVSITGGSAQGGAASGGGNDYNNSAFPLTVAFAANASSATVPVTIFQDSLLEATEDIAFALAVIDNATLGARQTARLEIRDDDAVVHQFLFHTGQNQTLNGSTVGNLHSNANIIAQAGNRQGNLTAVGNIDLQSGATQGNVTAGGTVTRAPFAFVTGTITSNAAVSPVALPQLSFGPFTGPNAGAGTLAPGSYNAVQVPASGTLNLSAGEYRINQLTLGANAELKLDLTAGPITIFVTSQLQLGNGSKMTLTGGTSLGVTINYAGTQTASFGTTSNYQGTLVAPLALVDLQSSSSYTGSICAQRITFGGSASARFHGN